MEKNAQEKIFSSFRKLEFDLHMTPEEGNLPSDFQGPTELFDNLDLLKSRGERGMKIEAFVSEKMQDLPSVLKEGDKDKALSRIGMAAFLLRKEDEGGRNFWWEGLKDLDFIILTKQVEENRIPGCLYSQKENDRLRRDKMGLSQEEVSRRMDAGEEVWDSAFVSLIDLLDVKNLSLQEAFDRLQSKYLQD